MGNYSDNLGLIHFTVHTRHDEDIKNALYKIFTHDCDFTENEEFFRKNTLELGYVDEADRLVSEYVKKHGRLNTLKKLTTAVEKLAKKVFDGSSYYDDYSVSVDEIGDNTFSVAIAYIS